MSKYNRSFDQRDNRGFQGGGREPPRHGGGSNDLEWDTRNLGPRRPERGGMNKRGRGHAPGMRQTTTYHQRQQDLSREIRQRKIQRQQGRQAPPMQQAHRPPNNNDTRVSSYASLGQNNQHSSNNSHNSNFLRQERPPAPPHHPNRGDRAPQYHPNNNRGGRPRQFNTGGGRSSYSHDSSNSSRSLGYQQRSPSRPPPKNRVPRPTPPLANSRAVEQRGTTHQQNPQQNNNYRGGGQPASCTQHPRAQPKPPPPPPKASDVIDLLSDSDGDDNEQPPPPPPRRPARNLEISHSNSDMSISTLSSTQVTSAAPQVPAKPVHASPPVAAKPAPKKPPPAAAAGPAAVAARKKVQAFLEDSSDEEEEEWEKNYHLKKGADDNRKMPPAETTTAAASPPRQKTMAPPPAAAKSANSPAGKTIIALSSDESSDEGEEDDRKPAAKTTARPTPTNNSRDPKPTQVREQPKQQHGPTGNAPAKLPPFKEQTKVPSTASAAEEQASTVTLEAESKKNQQTAARGSAALESSSRASSSKVARKDTSEEEEITGSNNNTGIPRPTTTKPQRPVVNQQFDDLDSDDESEREEMQLDDDDDDESSGSSSSDEEDEDSHRQTIAKKSVLSKKSAGGTLSQWKTPAVSTKSVGPKTPGRQKPKSRIYSSDSSSSESASDSDDDDSSSSESEDEEDSRRGRFAQKTAVNSGWEKQAARKSATLQAPPSSKSTSVSEESEEEESDDDDDVEVVRVREAPQHKLGSATLQPQEGEQKRGREEAFYTPTKHKAKRQKRSIDSEDSVVDLVGSDDSSEVAMEKQPLTTPSPLLQRRCRPRSKPQVFTPMESPHATAAGIGSNEDDDTLMVEVDHLTKVEINPVTGLPFMKITCHAEDAEILYDFRVDVATSGILNAGNGAFLSFLGARHLRDEAFSKSPQKVVKPLLLDDDLEAMGHQGFGIHVKLTGESIDAQRAQRPRGIGQKAVFEESDYEPSPTTVFSSKGKGNGLIHLGRYGPFRPADRKQHHDFDIKSFVLGYEASEWAFGCEEQLFGREEQIIDITDDLTGKPHEIAKINIPMYVNEVGHNKSLTQNVQSRTRFDRSIHYYINIEEPMKKGDKVELLTDYFETYEDIRMRKGYGKGNLNKGLKSEEDPKARYEYNCELRKIIAQRCRDLDLFAAYHMMEFVVEKIQEPLCQMVRRFLEAQQPNSKGSAPAPLCQQCVALVRLRYVGGILEKHLDVLERKFKKVRGLPKGYPWEGMLRQCKYWAQGMKKSIPMSSLWQLNVKDAEGTSIHDALRSEILEMRWYELSQELPSPYDPGMWCPIALRMINELSWEVTTHTGGRNESLVERLYRISVKAAKDVRKEASSPPSNISGLAFGSGVTSERAYVSARQIVSLKESFFEGHTLNPKGLLAEALDLLAYFEVTALSDDHHFVDKGFSLPVAPNKKLLMTKYEGFRRGVPLTSFPKFVEDCQKVSATVNAQWYLVWQVVYIANTFAAVFLPSDSSGAEAYSLQELCDRVGVDYTIAQPAIARGIRRQKVEPHIGKKPKTQNTSKKNKKGKKSDAKQNPFKRPPSIEISCGPPDENLEGGWPEGWKKRVFERQSGASKGHRDRYWYTPGNEFKLRSMSDVRKFMACLRTVGNNEELAWKMFKNKV